MKTELLVLLFAALCCLQTLTVSYETSSVKPECSCANIRERLLQQCAIVGSGQPTLRVCGLANEEISNIPIQLQSQVCVSLYLGSDSNAPHVTSHGTLLPNVSIGPDDFFMSARSDDAVYSIELTASKHENCWLYLGEFQPIDLGVYHFMAMVEYQHYGWNVEPPKSFQRKILAARRWLSRYRPFSVLSNVSVTVVAPSTYLPEKIAHCSGSEHSGRWIREPGSPLADSLGMKWAPLDCVYRYYSPQNIQDCFLQKRWGVIHWLGDSNSRRAIKTMLQPTRWCSNVTELTTPLGMQTCVCADKYEAGFPWAINETVPAVLWNGTSQVHLVQIGAVVRGRTWLDGPVPWFMFLDPNATSGYRKLPTPDMVVVTIGNWDSSQTVSLHWLEALMKFRDAVLQAYASLQIPIVVHMPEPFCCWSNRPWSHSTHGRVVAFATLIRRVFAGIPNVRIWDITRMFERPERVSLRGCYSTHHRPDVIRQHNQVLWNTLCNDARV